MPSSKNTRRSYDAELEEELDDAMRSSRMVGEMIIFLFLAGGIGLAIFLYLR